MQIARLARSKVTVCLSGDGGDEFFGGYGRYALATRLGDGIDRFPRWLRGLAGHGLTGLPVRFWDAALGGLRGTPLTGLRGGISGDRVPKLARLLEERDRDALYHVMLMVTTRPGAARKSGGQGKCERDSLSL